MKAIFNIAENVRNSHSINALSTLRKLQSLGLLLCTLLFGSMQMWGAIQGFPVNFTKSNYTGCTVISGYPATWTSNKALKTATKGVYFEKTTSGAYHLFTIPVRDFAANDSITVTLGGVQVSNTDYKHTFKMQYSTNGSSYTDFGSTWTESGSATQIQRGVKIPTAVASGSIYIKILSTAGGKSNGGNHYILTADITYTAGSGSTTYSIDDYITGSGSLSYEDEAEEGDEVEVTITPSSGYYLSEFTVYNGDTWDEIDATRVDGTHYSFVMPDAEVWVYATFSALPSYNITYSVPTCVTSPSGKLTSQTYFATPSESVPGYRFEGWVASAIPGTTGSKPGTIYQPGEVIPNNNMTVHALYSQVSATFTKQTGSTMPADGGNYMLCNSYSNTARVIKNAVDASNRATTKVWDCSGTTTTCTDWECIWVFKQGTGAYSDYWFIYNPQVGKYLGANSATAHASSPANYEVKLIDGMSDASAWTCTVEGGRITLVNKLRSGTSGTNETKLMSSGNYAGFGYSSGTAPFFFKNDAVSASYTTNPTCPTTDHTITFNANGGSGSMSPITDIEDGDDATLTSNTFSKDGYSFGGWTADVTVTIGGSPVSPGSTIANGATLQNITSDINLTAIWTPNPYRVDVASPSHVTIGVSSPSTIAEGGNANVNCGATVTLSESGLESGYLVVWDVYKTGESSTKVSVTGSGNGATFVMPAYGVTVNVTITAPYIYFTSCSSELTITYHANGGTGNVPVDANIYAKDDAVTVLDNIGSPALTRDGYTFSGWNTAPDGSGTSKKAGQTYTITSNTTFYAVWTPNNYKITSISTNPASSGTVTATYNAATVVAGTTEIPCGSEVTLSQEANRDKTFTSWTIKNASTSADVTATYLDGNTLTMPPFNCTVTANYSAKSSCVVTFSLQSGTISTTTIGGTDYTTAVTLYDGESITTLPTVSSISCGDWGTVVGWTTNSSYSESSTPPTYITAPYNPGSNTTIYAVYRKTDGSADFDGTNDGTYKVRGGGSSGASDNYATGSCGSSSYSSTTTKASGTSFTFTKNTTHTSYYNISCGDGTYITCTSNDTPLGTTTSDHINDDAALWAPSQVGSNGGTGSGFWIFNNKGTTNRDFAYDGRYSQQKFMAVSHGNVTNTGADYYPIKLESASTSYYSINPVCGTTYDITKGLCTPNNTVLDASSHYCDFSLSTTSVSSGGMVTVTLTPNDDYTYNASSVTITGGGSASIGSISESAGVITCNITGITADMTVNVTYVAKPLYTVTLYDNGTKRGELTEEHFGAGVTLPSGNNCTPSSAFTFEGWTESAVELNADPVRPATLHAAGSYSPTSNITLYSVYSRSVDGCEDFAAGKSGAYTVYRASYYAQATGTDIRFDIATTSTNAAVFYISYFAGKNGYTIRTKDGYVGWNHDGSNITKTATTPYYWNITGSAGTGWKFTPQGISGEYLSLSTTGYFKMYATDNGYNTLTKTAMTYYYNTALCGDAKITFHDGGGTISGTPTTPDGASWNSGTHVLSGLEDCDKITTFPTANYDGWTFIGWSTEDYSNSGKHTADHAEENASTDEPDGSIIYKTGGNPYVVRGGSIDLYPVFTRFPDNEPFNTESGGDYYIYYLKPGTDDGYGANIRVYAGEYDGEKRYGQTTSCAAATTFTFTKSGDVWHIQNKANSKYIGGKSNEDWLVENASLGTLTDWTITIKSGNQFYASCQGGGRYISFSTSANYFMDYSTTANPGICLPVYLGSCTERIFSSEPNPTPTIDLTGEPMVTSSVGQQVRATETMTLSASHLGSVPANKIIVSGTNLKFATTASATPSTTLSLSLTEGNLAATTIYVYYTPAAGDTEDGLENIVVTAKAYYTTTPKDVQTTGIVHARHLPADFVIAAKWGDKWYALPNTCAGEGSNTAGVLIEVNDANAPTAATAAPHTAKWGMRQTKAGSRSDGSYNDRLVFTERTTATANDQKTLYNYNKAEVFTNATYTNYNNKNPERYEWIPVTTDFGDYELTNANNADHHLILRNSDGTFVAQNSDKSYDGKVRLLPATFYEEAPVQIVEWKASAVVVMYTGTEASAKAKVGTNSETSDQTLSTRKLTHGVYELNTGTALTSNAGKNLLLTFGTTKKTFEIPWIINGSSNAASGHEKQDVVILKNGKLTAQSTKYSFRNIYVYGGGKLKIASGTSLGVNNIILRAGGITTSGIGSSPSATYEYIYPQVELRGTLSSTKTNIKYEYITDYDHWYHLILPFDGTLSSITYPQEYYGDNVTAANTGSWVIKRYAGEVRATGNYDAWKDIENEGATSVTAGHGYIFWGAPKKVSVGGAAKQRQQWGIQRITMPVTAAAAMEAENANKVVGGLGSYSGVSGNSGKDNDQGWNLIGDPYLTNLTNLSGTGIHTCKLVEVLDGNDNWTGRWEWNDETSVRYLTIPDYHFDNYKAKTISVAVAAGDLNTGHTFFVQIEGEATGVTFEQANRAVLLPALYAETDRSIDVETGIVMADESHSDEVNFWIKDGKTAEYEYNADYPKTPNSSNFNLYGVHSHGDLSWIAISPEIAEGSMAIGYQVPTAGEYLLSLSETYVSDKIDQLLVTDHEMSPEITTNLLTEDYVFQVNQAETNNTRFTVSIRLAPQTPTDIGNVPSEGMNAANAKPQKFIYHDKMYILRNGVIYDATGKKVGEINK